MRTKDIYSTRLRQNPLAVGATIKALHAACESSIDEGKRKKKRESSLWGKHSYIVKVTISMQKREGGRRKKKKKREDHQFYPTKYRHAHI